MNTAERHDNDTTIVLRGVVVKSDNIETATELAAAVYVEQVQHLHPCDWPTLPEGLTGEDIERAVRRAESKRVADMAKVDEYVHDACKTAPKSERFLCTVHDCTNVSDHAGPCDSCAHDIECDRLDRKAGLAFWPALVVVLLVLAALWFGLPKVRDGLNAAWHWFEVQK